jgi:YVTN family beta-propeller protein
MQVANSKLLTKAFMLVILVASASYASTKIYTSNEESGDIAVIDADTGQVLRRIPVGKRPRGLKLSADNKLLYVALSGSAIAGPGIDESKLAPADRAADGIGVINLFSYRLEKILPSGQDPETFDVSSDGKTLYISNEETAEISVLDVQSGKVTKKVAVGREPEGITLRPDGKVVYVACEGDSEVVAIATNNFSVLSRMQTALRPRSVVFTKDGTEAFVPAERGASVTVLDATRHKPITTIVIPSASGISPARPMGSVLSPDGRSVFVSNGRGESVSVIGVANHQLLRTIKDVGMRPWGIGVSADGKRIYTANGPSDDVSVIDVESGRVENRISVAGHPWGIVVAN